MIRFFYFAERHCQDKGKKSKDKAYDTEGMEKYVQDIAFGPCGSVRMLISTCYAFEMLF
jgi:hypothetical protein